MYTDIEAMDLGALEREAFQRGDTLLAGLAAFALDASTDAEGELAEVQRERDEAADLQREADEALSALRFEVRDAVDALERAIEGAKRLGNREAIEAALTKLLEITQ